ncbi:MAG: S8 family serine peptidase [Sphingomonadaceae bacterium]|nr:S8 family serine peptidase [Sphingomonadaceae bacterium]
MGPTLRPRSMFAIAMAAAALCGPAAAQLIPQAPSLPPVGGVIDQVGRTGQMAVDQLQPTLGEVRQSAGALAHARVERLEALVRANRDRLEMTELGPAVRGEVIAVDPDAASIAAAEGAGFTRLSEERIEGLDLREVTLGVPRGWSLDRALSRLRRLAPAGQFTANHLHGQSGAVAAAVTGSAALAEARAPGSSAVGVIDGGVAIHPALRGGIQQRGFAAGAPRPSAHGTAVASLIAGQGPVRGAAPGAALVVADIYGSDPAGGNALALARALGWMALQRVPVVAVSLVGPSNLLVARAIAEAQARGVRVVAAVGNDGPAAPPAFPASYPGVIAVTGVDGRGRVLAEAGRAAHLDYAAPGADMAAASPSGGLAPVRGTSFAVPFVAGRLAAHARSAQPLAALDAEASERGRRGVGRGVICGDCRTLYRR